MSPYPLKSKAVEVTTDLNEFLKNESKKYFIYSFIELKNKLYAIVTERKCQDITYDEITRDIEDISEVVAEQFGYTLKEVMATTRLRSVVNVRQLAMYICKTERKYNLKSIGYYFNKHHATVIHAIKVVNNFIECNDPYVNEDILSRIKEKINNLERL